MAVFSPAESHTRLMDSLKTKYSLKYVDRWFYLHLKLKAGLKKLMLIMTVVSFKDFLSDEITDIGDEISI